MSQAPGRLELTRGNRSWLPTMRQPEKRKVGGSTPPLTTTTDLHKTVSHLRKRAITRASVLVSIL